MTKRRAVTLVELVIVMVIVAILAAMAMPRFANVMRRQRLDAASRRIMDDLRAARFAAISQKKEHGMTFVLAKQSYVWHEGNEADSEDEVVRFDEPPYQRIQLRDASFADGSPKVTFDHLGLPDSGGQIVLADGAEKVVLVVSPTTGRVTRTFSDAADLSGGGG